MTITIGLGWWMIPAAITLAAFLWARWADRSNHQGCYGYAAIGAAMGSLVVYSLALAVSLAAWLVYFIIF